jgi:hypothetical protein
MALKGSTQNEHAEHIMEYNAYKMNSSKHMIGEDSVIKADRNKNLDMPLQIKIDKLQ